MPVEHFEVVIVGWDLFRYPGVRPYSDVFTLGYLCSPVAEADSLTKVESVASKVRILTRE